MPRNTVAEVLECFDDEFAEVAAAFARGEYPLWLGSGISRDVVPDVPTLLQRILEFLQTRVDVSNPTCRFRAALAEILEAAGSPAAAGFGHEPTSVVCAVRAAKDPDEYRKRLIARISQISGWTEKSENQMMKDRLGYLFGSRPALIVGMSAQDANIHTVFHKAIQNWTGVAAWRRNHAQVKSASPSTRMVWPVT
jgi:hypothetical protein